MKSVFEMDFCATDEEEDVYAEQADHNPYAEQVCQTIINDKIQKTFGGLRHVSTEKMPKELNSIRKSLSDFFADQDWHAGGEIPDEVLFTKTNFFILNNISLINAIDLAYCCVAFDEAKFHIRNHNAEKAAEKLKEVYEQNKSSVVREQIGLLKNCDEKKKKTEVYRSREHYDIKTCIEIIGKCQNLKIPATHQGGVFLVYLNICVGIQLLD